MRVAKKKRKHFCGSAVKQKEGLSDAPMSARRVVKQEYAHGTLTHLCNAKQDIRSTWFINRVGRRYVPFTSGYTWARHRENLLTVSSSMVTRMGLQQLATRLPGLRIIFTPRTNRRRGVFFNSVSPTKTSRSQLVFLDTGDVCFVSAPASSGKQSYAIIYCGSVTVVDDICEHLSLCGLRNGLVRLGH